MALFEVNGLSVTAGEARLLDMVSLAIEPGERLGIVGESGSGKTTLALALTGLLPHGVTTAGSIAFDGAPLPAAETELARLRGRRIGFILQNPADALDPLMRVGVQVAEALALAGKGNGSTAEIEALLAAVGLAAAHAGRFPQDLSVGERQLALIAMALAPEPELLIADEPTSALDLGAQRRVFDLIERHCSDRGMGLVLISPDLKAVAALCNRILVLDRGRAVETGDKLAIFGSPRHDMTKQLIAAGRHRARTLMRSPIGAPLLEASNLVRRFRRPDISIFEPRPPLLALDDVSFSLRTGESVALIGPSGAGKSTLARIIAGLDRASSGSLVFDHQTYHGSDLPRMLRRDISLVFPDPARSFNPRLTIGESVAEPLRLEPQRLAEEIEERMLEVVKAVGLAPWMLDRYPHDLSIGQRQRFAIARALVTKPRLVVLDEPVALLDVVERGEVLVMLNRLRADFGLTFFVIGHDFELVRIVADRVMVMDKGKIIETGTPAQLLDAPREQVTRELVAARLPEVGIVPAS